MQAGESLGCLTLLTSSKTEFAADEIALAESFRDQAIIALQNTRLFLETREALEQQTATADVLRAISEDAFDLPAVLQALISTAGPLVRGHDLYPV